MNDADLTEDQANELEGLLDYLATLVKEKGLDRKTLRELVFTCTLELAHGDPFRGLATLSDGIAVMILGKGNERE